MMWGLFSLVVLLGVGLLDINQSKKNINMADKSTKRLSMAVVLIERYWGLQLPRVGAATCCMVHPSSFRDCASVRSTHPVTGTAGGGGGW